MAYFKIVLNDYVVSIGTYNGELNSPIANVITKAEYDSIVSIYANRPRRTETTNYRLKADLTWESYEVEPPELDAIIPYDMDGE